MLEVLLPYLSPAGSSLVECCVSMAKEEKLISGSNVLQQIQPFSWCSRNERKAIKKSSSIHWGQKCFSRHKKKWVERAHGHTYNSNSLKRAS